MLNCIVSAAEKQEEIKTWLTKAFKNQWTLIMNEEKRQQKKLFEAMSPELQQVNHFSCDTVLCL